MTILSACSPKRRTKLHHASELVRYEEALRNCQTSAVTAKSGAAAVHLRRFVKILAMFLFAVPEKSGRTANGSLC